MKSTSRIALTAILSLTALAAAAVTNVIFVGETRQITVRLGSLPPTVTGTGFAKTNALTCQGSGSVTFEEGNLSFSNNGVAVTPVTGTAPGPANILIRSGSVTNAVLPLVVVGVRAKPLGGGCAWPYELLDCSTNIVPHDADGFLEVVVDDGPGTNDAVAVSVFIAELVSASSRTGRSSPCHSAARHTR